MTHLLWAINKHMVFTGECSLWSCYRK